MQTEIARHTSGSRKQTPSFNESHANIFAREKVYENSVLGVILVDHMCLRVGLSSTSKPDEEMISR